MSRFFQFAALVVAALAANICCGQSYSNQYGPPPQFIDSGSGYSGGSAYESALGGRCGGGGCDCGDCGAIGGAGAVFDGAGGRAGRGPVRNLVRASRIQPDCADCNIGPVYLSLFGGVSFLDNFDSRFTFDNGVAGELGIQETGFSMDDGVASGASIGKYLYRQARIEFEYTYRDNSVDAFETFTFADDLTTPQINDTLVGSTSAPADGSVESSSFIFNLVMDLKPRTVGCLNGYIGGGIGALAVDGDAVADSTTFLFDDAAFAFQGIAGVNYPVLDRLDLFTEYRYLGSNNIRVESSDATGVTSLGAFRFDSHNVVFGIRILR